MIKFDVLNCTLSQWNSKASALNENSPNYALCHSIVDLCLYKFH